MIDSLKRLFGYAPCLYAKGPEGYYYSYNEGITWVVCSFWYLPAGIAFNMFESWILTLKMKWVLRKKRSWANIVVLDSTEMYSGSDNPGFPPFEQLGAKDDQFE